MTLYLHIGVGAYESLLPTAPIAEIVELDSDETPVVDPNEGDYEPIQHRPWRRSKLPILDMRAVLECDRSCPARYSIVYTNEADGTTLYLDVDQVHGLVHLDDAQLAGLPSLSQRVSAFFDKIYVPDDAEGMLLRVRADLDFCGALLDR